MAFKVAFGIPTVHPPPTWPGFKGDKGKTADERTKKKKKLTALCSDDREEAAEGVGECCCWWLFEVAWAADGVLPLMTLRCGASQ